MAFEFGRDECSEGFNDGGDAGGRKGSGNVSGVALGETSFELRLIFDAV